MKTLIIPFICISAALVGHAQGQFASGVRVGAGATPGAIHPVITYKNGGTENLIPNAAYSVGFVGAYLLTEQLGIESGLQWTLQGYSKRNGIGYSRQKFLMSSISGFPTCNFYIPVLVTYKFYLLSFNSIKLAAGVSLDWLSTGVLNNYKAASYQRKIISSIRFGSMGGALKQFEYGLEYQFALKRFGLVEENNARLIGNSLDSRIQLLSAVVYYRVEKNKRVKS